jgi:cell division protein FtsN
MAHQDYVSRSRVKNKKQSSYKKNVEPAQGNSLKVKLIAAFLVIALPSFGYLLWSIKDKQPVGIVAPKVIKVKKTTEVAELPELQREKWTYVDDLKSKKVEVGQYEVKKKGPYKMQCGSFRTRKQAESLKARIAFTGLEAQVSKSVSSSSTWYKVYLGPYDKKRNAEKDKHKLKNNAIHACKIWGWD